MKRVMFGIDVAIAGEDRTYISVYDASEKEFIGQEGFYPSSFNEFRTRLAAMYNRYHPSVIVMDVNAGAQVTHEALIAEGFPVQPFIVTKRSKENLKAILQESLRRGEVRSPWQVELRDDRLDDSWVAMALSLWAASNYGAARVDFL